MRILVTGGAGFIGSHVVDKLLQNGHEVYVLDNLSTGLRANVPVDVSIFEVDLNDPEAVNRTVEKVQPEAIYHFAAQISVPRSFADPAFDASVNILGILHLCSAARALSKPPRFIFASSGGAVYGDAKELPSTEATPPNPATPYGLSKLAGEMYLRLFEKTWSMPTVILRFSNVYGPRQGSSLETGVCAVFVKQALAGHALTVYGDGTQTRDYVYVEDLARAALLALTRGQGETINLSSGVETSTNELADLVSKLSPSPIEIRHLPDRPGDVARSWLSPAQARKMLEWEPLVSQPEGLRRTFLAN